MRLWLFIFTQPDRVITSARVAAPTRAEAAVIMGNQIGRPLLGANNQAPEPGTILSSFGKMDCPAGLVSFVDNNGEVHETRLS